MFFKKNKAKKISKIESTFSINKLEQNGEIYLLRFRNDILSHVEIKSYPFQLGIAVKLHTNQNGFPTKEENEQLLNMEEILDKDFSKDNVGLFVGAILGGGIKEFVFYSGKPKEASSLFEKLKGEIKHHELQCVVREDPEWEIYKTYCPQK